MQVPVLNSSEISYFGVKVTVDLFNRKMIFDTSELTTFLNSPAGFDCSIAFGVKDSDGLWLTGIDWSDKSAVWSSPQITDASIESSYEFKLFDNYPFLFQEYKIYAGIQDSLGNKTYLEFPVKKVCKPNDFTDYGYVFGNIDLKADCNNQLITVNDYTNTTYLEKEPTSIDRNGTLYYPRGTVADLNFTNTPFTNNAVYTGTYTISNDVIADYDLGNDFFVQVRYVVDNVDFAIRCGNVMAEVICCLDELQKKYEKNCDNAIGKQAFADMQKVIFPMMSGFSAELRGQDASMYAKKIQEILKCDCGCNGVKKIAAKPVNPLIYNIVVNGGGDVVVTPTVVGNTKTFTVTSKIYEIVKADNLDLAWSITLDTTVANTVKYKIAFDYKLMANYILTQIGNDNALLTQFNSLVINNGANIDLSNLDGKCVIDLSSTNFFLTQKFAQAQTVVKNILVGSTTYSAPPYLFIGNPTGIENWLNGVSPNIGTFSASFNSSINGSFSSILSNANFNDLVSVTYTTSSGDVTVPFQKTNVSLVAFLQALVDYLCELSALDITLGINTTLCSINSLGQVVSTEYPSTTLLSEFNTQLAAITCSFAEKIASISGIDCTSIKKLFPSNIAIMQDTDYVLGTKGGFCSRIGIVELIKRGLYYLQFDQEGIDLVCYLNSLCNGGKVCEQFSLYEISKSEHSPADDSFDLNVTFAHPSAISVDITYARVDNTSTPVYTTINTLIGTSPYTINNLPQGTYNVGIKPIYADGRLCNYTYLQTENCEGVSSFGTALSNSGGVDYIDVTYAATSPKVRVKVSYPNGGFNTYIYNNGDVISIALPSNIYGNFTVTIQPLCNETTGWYGQESNPSIVTLASPNGGRFIATNDTSAGLLLRNVFGVGGVVYSAQIGTLAAGEIGSANYTAFSGVIQVVLTGTYSLASQLRLNVGGVDVETLPVAATGAFNFTTNSYDGVQNIIITLEEIL